MKKHIIVHLVRGEAKEAHEAITKDLAAQFDSFPIHERLPPHFTLKRWFEIDEQGMAAVRKTIDAFAASHTQSDYRLVGFNHFDDKVIYVDVEASENMRTSIVALLDSLRKIENLEFDEFDNDGVVLHATVAMSALKAFDFPKLWSYLQTTDAPDFALKFDNVTLLRRDADAWTVDTLWELPAL